jgi:hypothetical protein
VADPYAKRGDLAPPERIAPESSPAADVVRAAGGVVLRSPADIGGRLDASFAAVVVEELAVLPPLARIGPELAVALLCDPAAGGAQDDAAVAAARALLDADVSLFLLKDGSVAGPAGRPGARELSAERLAAALAAALAGDVRWEMDPDFRYEIAAGVPGFAGDEADAFVPRLLFAAYDRVYEHAELVEVTKRRRHQRLTECGVVDEGILAAVGWPIEATGQAWKD